jgi:hypothetical protein
LSRARRRRWQLDVISLTPSRPKSPANAPINRALRAAEFADSCAIRLRASGAAGL